MKYLEAAGLAAIALAACRAPSAPPRVPDVERRLDAMFGELHRRKLFEGAVSIERDGHVLYERGFGLANAEAGARFLPDTPADGGSIAKTFTATLVLDLAREGKLDLDASIQRLLPELPYPSITLRHLLSHTSALPLDDYEVLAAHLPPDRPRTTEDLLGVLAARALPITREVGAAFAYSNLGYDLAALAAARAAGAPLAEVLAARYFVPLGLSSTFLRPGRLSEFPQPRTLGYRLVGGVRELHDVFDLEAFHGASNIYVSARDLRRWAAAWLARPRPIADQPARVGGAASALSLGSWYCTPDRTACWYPGHHQGFHVVAYRDARAKVALAYVSSSTLEPWLQHAIVRGVLAILDGRVPVLAPPMLDPHGDGAPLLGIWRLDDGRVLAIERDGDRTSLRWGGVAYPIFPVDERLHYVPGVDVMIGRAGDRIYVAGTIDERRGERVQAEHSSTW